MIRFENLPAWNAVLNGTAALLLLSGYVMIRRRNIRAHRACMVSALVLSSVFLATYLIYHAKAGVTHFERTGLVRPVYFAILISHTVLAALVPPLAVTTIYFALRGRFNRHRRLARITLPVWLYVSVTGVVIFRMLYRA